LRQAVRLAPNEPLIRIQLAQALLATPDIKNVDEGISNIRTALTRDASSTMAYRELATAYARKGDAAEGLARQLYLAKADLASANAYLSEGRLDLAKQQATRAKAGLIDGTPDWLRADDILASEPAVDRSTQLAVKPVPWLNSLLAHVRIKN
jgi:predicted Zn-dependent protease